LALGSISISIAIPIPTRLASPTPRRNLTHQQTFKQSSHPHHIGREPFPRAHIAYYADEDGDGRPLLLVHSVNAAPSSFEVKPIFERWRGARPVYSLDLPGFGQSERGARAYTPELYADAIVAMLEQVIGAPTDVLALSLGAEFAARAALAAPRSIASLVLVSPTGFSARATPGPGFSRVARNVLTVPLWSQGLFDLLTSRPSIRHYLNKSFVGAAPQVSLPRRATAR
jgi:pimeloyl-ACP methyl ester carboxylesterase